MTRPIFILLVLFISIQSAAQDIIKMSTGTVSTCNAYLLDADSMQGNYPAGIYTLRINSASGSRLAFNPDYFDIPSGDTVWVYDGPDTNSPLLFQRPIAIMNNLRPSAQSSGSSITVKLRAFPQVPGVPRKFRATVRCITDPANLPTFVPITRNIYGGPIKLADYDKDGDQDLLVGGEILRNDNYLDSLFMFDRKVNPLGRWTSTRMLAHDFDSDGDKDIFITGASNEPGSYAPYAALYSNNGSGEFTRVTTQTFTGLYAGAVSIVDYNRDGKMDICYTGRVTLTGTPATNFKIYLNNGNMSFTDAFVSLPGTFGLISASMDWADCDADGDADLLINGISAGVNFTRLFLLSPSGFTQLPIGLTNVSDGQIKWVDVNKDGRPDIINTGVTTPGHIDAIVPQLFINGGGNVFTNVPTNLPAWSLASHDWTDYDADNDLDAVFSGMETIGSNSSFNAAVFKYNGNGNFIRKTIDSARGGASVKWVSVNGDAQPDLFVGGRNYKYSYYLKNMGNDSFKVSSFPFASYLSSGRVALAEDFTGDGVIDALFADELDAIDCNGEYYSMLVRGIGWRISGIPKYTVVTNLNNLLIPFPSGTTSDSKYWKWGDYDSDGVLDVLFFNYNGQFGPVIYALRNNGNNNFSIAFNPTVTNIPGFERNVRDAAMVDLDNDGINEWFITPHTVLKKSGTSWTVKYEVAGCHPFSCPYWYVDFGDFNNDGFQDAAVSWQSDQVGFGTVQILKNDGTGKLEYYGPTNYAKWGRQIRWYDIDRDNDLDLVVGGLILENRNNEFAVLNCGTEVANHFAIGDFNNDNSDDIATVGGYFVPDHFPGSFYYGMQNTNFFKKTDPGKLYTSSNQAWEESIEALDIDNDGDIDIAHTAGGIGCNTGLLINLNNITRQNLQLWTPNGGETYSIGSSHQIRWIGSLLGPSVKIEISRDNGLSWQVITAATPTASTGGSYNWNVNGPVADNCKVRVTDNSTTSMVDLSNQTFRITVATGVGQVNLNSEISIYPNPANGRFYVKTPTSMGRNVVLTVSNAVGTVLLQQQVTSSQLGTTGTDISKFPPGFYLVTIADGNNFYNAKLIKLR